VHRLHARRVATQTHQALSEALPDVMVGLLHSRMPVAEKKAVMSLFNDDVMAVLVSTTVIQVGVDVPNAPLMLDQHAELAHRHVLRWLGGKAEFLKA